MGNKTNPHTQERIVSFEREMVKFYLYSNFIKIALKINQISVAEMKGNFTILTHFHTVN